MDKQTDNLWKIYESINSWIRFSDTKAAAILASSGVILTIIFSNISKFFQLIGCNSLLMDFTIVFVTIGAISGIISIIYSINCLIPRINVDKENINYKDSVIFFNDINERYENPNSYYTDVKKVLSDSNLDPHISQEIWINSKIASLKYKSVKWSIRALGVSIFFLIFPLLIAVISWW